MKKNQIVELYIKDLNDKGEGIATFEDKTVYVKDAAIADVVQAKIIKVTAKHAYAKLQKIINSSKDRTTPFCNIAIPCGGCQIQHIKYEKQLEYKTTKVLKTLNETGGIDKRILNEVAQPIIGMKTPVRYRNKALFPFTTNKQGEVITGLYASRTHKIIENTDCPIGVKQNQIILETIIKFMREHKITAYNEESGSGIVRHVLIRSGFTTGELLVCLVINADYIPKQEVLVQCLKQIKGVKSICISVNKNQNNTIMGNNYKKIWGKEYITDYIGQICYKISPLSFFQVNPVQTKHLYDLVLEYAQLTGKETVWDLYCGIGTISLYLAKYAKQVYGVEIVPEAIEDAKKNSDLNNIKNAEFFVGKAEEILPKYIDEQIENTNTYPEIDLVVLDPPRKGCEQHLLETIIQSKVKKIIYVSCECKTLARDLKILLSNGYEIKHLRPVDQFCHNVHVETVVLLTRK